MGYAGDATADWHTTGDGLALRRISARPTQAVALSDERARPSSRSRPKSTRPRTIVAETAAVRQPRLPADCLAVVMDNPPAVPLLLRVLQAARKHRAYLSRDIAVPHFVRFATQAACAKPNIGVEGA